MISWRRLRLNRYFESTATIDASHRPCVPRSRIKFSRSVEQNHPIGIEACDVWLYVRVFSRKYKDSSFLCIAFRELKHQCQMEKQNIRGNTLSIFVKTYIDYSEYRWFISSLDVPFSHFVAIVKVCYKSCRILLFHKYHSLIINENMINTCL